MRPNPQETAALATFTEEILNGKLNFSCSILVNDFQRRIQNLIKHHKSDIFRGGSRAAATSKMECFVIIVNGFQPLTIITKRSILDVAAVLDPPLIFVKMSLIIVVDYNEYDNFCYFQLPKVVKSNPFQSQF